MDWMGKKMKDCKVEIAWVVVAEGVLNLKMLVLGHCESMCDESDKR